jgi:hypothetical protein
MEITARAIETTGTIDSQNKLVLDENLPVMGPARVRVIILLQEETEIDEMRWLKAAQNNPVFDFLKDREEDIYTLDDGRPFHDKK